MRFETTDQVREYAELAATDDVARSKRGFDINPYCTVDARHTWERGYIGAPAKPWEPSLLWNTMYQRGAAAQRIVEAKA